jgi:hypothetical protein
LTLSSAGVISGIPTVAGAFPFTVKASNGVTPDATAQLSITINGASDGGGTEPTEPTGPATTAPAITTPATLAAGTAGAAYTQSLTASGGGTVTWTLVDGDLPLGLTLSSAGVISGVPTAAGVFTFTVKASNGAPPDATLELTITIAGAPGNGGETRGGGGSGGSGGCATGFGFLPVILAAAGAMKKRRMW